jgi:hypothetical protein
MRKLQHLETTVTNRRLIYEQIKKGVNSGKVCYHSIHNFLSSRLLPTIVNINTKKYNFACGCVQM